jgi:sugar/nucleoside kinase (ribokinase family)
MTPAFDIVGLGLATVDILTLAPRLPQPDDVLAARQIVIQGGGPVATALAAAARLGAAVAYLGPIGRGRWGEFTLAEFGREGVETAFAPLSDLGDQSLSVILIDEATGRRSILYARGGLPDLAPAAVPPDLIAQARALHLDGGHIAAALHAARLARAAGVIVSFDGGAGERWPGIDELLPLVDVMVVARRFAEEYTGEGDAQAAGPALLAAYRPRLVVITDGENGAWYWDGEQRFHQPAFPVAVVDTTGAGDVFHGAFLHAHLQGWPPQRCLAFAAAAAALKCRQLGGRAGAPTGAEVELTLGAGLARGQVHRPGLPA